MCYASRVLFLFFLRFAKVVASSRVDLSSARFKYTRHVDKFHFLVNETSYERSLFEIYLRLVSRIVVTQRYAALLIVPRSLGQPVWRVNAGTNANKCLIQRWTPEAAVTLVVGGTTLALSFHSWHLHFIPRRCVIPWQETPNTRSLPRICTLEFTNIVAALRYRPLGTGGWPGDRHGNDTPARLDGRDRDNDDNDIGFNASYEMHRRANRTGIAWFRVCSSDVIS